MRQVIVTSVLVKILFSGLTLSAQDKPPKFEVGAQYSYLGSDGPSFGKWSYNSSLGGRVVYNPLRWLSLEAEMNFFVEEPSGRNVFQGGRAFQGQFGPKFGIRKGRFGIFGKVRPGFFSFGDALLDIRALGPPVQLETGRLTVPALDSGGVLEIYPSRRWTFRFDLGNTSLFYRERSMTLGGSVPGQTRNSFQFSSGVLFRF
jgi:hypothetical protein